MKKIQRNSINKKQNGLKKSKNEKIIYPPTGMQPNPCVSQTSIKK